MIEWWVGFYFTAKNVLPFGRSSPPVVSDQFVQALFLSYAYHMSFPKNLYPTEDSLPSHRVEIELFPELRSAVVPAQQAK